MSAAEHHRTAAEKAGGDGALESLRRGGVGHARGDDARHEAVFGDGGEHRVGEAFLLGARLVAGDQQPEIAGEIDLADNVVAEIAPADDNAFRRRGGNGAERVILFANAHDFIPFIRGGRGPLR